MIRICTSLVRWGLNVTLVGKCFHTSALLQQQPYNQKRIYCRFKKGKRSYIEFNLKLFRFLLFTRAQCYCAIDLDTIMPVLLTSKLKKTARVYDAHELFTEMKEVITRPLVKKAWDTLERLAVPAFPLGYTVSDSIASILYKRYGVSYYTVRNVPLKENAAPPVTKDAYILYQGAVNEGRGLEYLIPAMKYVDRPLIICGDGNFIDECRELVSGLGLQSKITFTGMLFPEELKKITASSCLGVNLIEPYGKNQLFSLANKFFDYIHAAVPQLTMNFREYAQINNQYKVALLIDVLDIKHIADQLNFLLQNTVLYTELQQKCLEAREIYNWQEEEKKLINFYSQIFR